MPLKNAILPFLYNFFRIIDRNGGKPPLTYKAFQNILMNMDLPPLPQSTIGVEDVEDKYTPILDDHDEKYGVPTLEELGESFTT